MIDFLRSLDLLNELIDFMHLGSLAGAFYFALGLTGFIWLYRRQTTLGKRQTDIEKRLHILDEPDVGRVNKLSNLVEQEIADSKKALRIAERVAGKIEGLLEALKL